MRSADVVIVGAGFAGCATAWALAERGIRAIVIEREAELGHHASGRGAGLGRQLAEDDDTTQLAVRGAAILRERFAECWQPTGGILTFDDDRHAQIYVDRARRLDVPHGQIDRAAVLAHWPMMGRLPIAAAIRIPRDGVIDIKGLLHAYASQVAIQYGARVSRVEPQRRGVRIEVVPNATSNVVAREAATSSKVSVEDAAREIETGSLTINDISTIDARVIVDAAGAWAGELTDDPPLESFKRHLFTLEATAPSNAPYFWNLGANELYVRRDGDGVLACACDAEVTPAIDQRPSPDADARLRARLPPGWDPAIAKRWACQRAFAPDRKMRIGRDPKRPWLVWAAALGGHGATASAAIGERTAAAVMEVLG